MVRVRFMRRARQDLHQIWQWIDAANGERRADEITARIVRRIATLETFPMLGPACPDFDETARTLLVMRWIVVYSAHDAEVRIIRIFDSSSDLFRQMLGPSG